MSIANTTPEKFLKEHIGHGWHAVSYDDMQYGFAGEDILISPASAQHSANGYQSALLSPHVATKLCDKLAELGFTNSEDFTRVGVGHSDTVEATTHTLTANHKEAQPVGLKEVAAPLTAVHYANKGDTEAVTVVFTLKGVAKAMQNAALMDATRDAALLDKTGREEFAEAHHPSNLMSPREKALRFLDEAIHTAVPNTLWNTEYGDYSLKNLELEDSEKIRLALRDKGVVCVVRPHVINQTVKAGDIATGVERKTVANVTVRAVTMDRVLGTASENRGRVDASSETAIYLQDAVYDIAPEGTWSRPVEGFSMDAGGKYVLQGVTLDKLNEIQAVLKGRGIISEIVDGDQAGSHELEVKSFALNVAMENAKREASYGTHR